MTILVPMRAEAFDTFVREVVINHARDGVIAGRWRAQEAQASAQHEFGRLLPQGFATPGQWLYDIVDDNGDQPVGTLWFGIIETDSARHGQLYSLRIKPEFRGRGHAKAALDLIEQIATSAGLASIALHVFGFNTGAQALYRAAGYGITGLNMRKRLGGQDPA